MKFVALLICLGLAQLAHAQDERGMYIGGTLGSFDYDENAGDGEFGISDSSYAYRFFAGYKFNEYFAIEGGIGRTGEIEGSFEGPSPFGTVTYNLDGIFDLYTATVLGSLPLDSFSLFLGAGYYSASLSGEVNVDGFGTIGGLDGHENGASAVFGIQKDFGLDLKSVSVRAQYEWYDFPEGIDASGISVGFLYRF